VVPVTVDLDVHQLAATRFAMSPLGETVAALQVLGQARINVHLRPWLRWARREVDRAELSLPTAWPLLVTKRPTWPEFLAPAPHVPEPAIEDELARMRSTRAEQVRASIDRVFGAQPPAAVTAVARHPAASLRAVAAELLAAYDLLVAPHWPRLQAVLASDIAYRARRLAIGGVEGLLADLHPEVSWANGRLTLQRIHTDRRVTLGNRGLVLIPTVLGGEDVKIRLSTTTQITLRYPARGSATLWTAGLHEPRSSVVSLLGRPRARVLAAVRSPATTGGLARALGVTPSAVSQQLRVLRASDLVRSERSGRNVLHLATDLGLALLDP
jgi:hypothetical protein